LAATHTSQGSDMGLCGGLLGWEPTDARLVRSAASIREAGIRVSFQIADYGATHPNTYRLTLKSNQETHELTALSTGGGMIEITAIDGADVSICGDYFETLVYTDDDAADIIELLKKQTTVEAVRLCRSEATRFVEIKTRSPLDPRILETLTAGETVRRIKHLAPVLPVLSARQIRVPFVGCAEMEGYNRRRKLSLWELALRYESARGGISEAEVYERMEQIVGILRRAVAEGLQGTQFQDRILGCQSASFKSRLASGRLLDAGILNRMTLYITALMEVKSAMGVIVAAPTAGACGALPGACLGAADVMGLAEEKVIRGMLAAGLVGVFIAARSTFAAEVGGCQAECGAASGMAAAALVTLAGGTTGQAVAAAAMALQNVFGLVCDPVAGRVEVPCLGKNVLAAGNALTAANMALADFDPVIPLDEVITAMDQVGRSLPGALRCTARGGLAVTPTSRAIRERLG
ncbi:MAG: L-serine ammonia-lyase, iron-sulfur-dependent, subunit alpha, partial [Desulfobacterales bacterium]|nr:L-serine ammonia-lyase, iron-sulfur-dependent, subunit alpha [Desulfobacterales bacterium]